MDTKSLLTNQLYDLTNQLVELASEQRSPGQATVFRMRGTEIANEVKTTIRLLLSLQVDTESKYSEFKDVTAAVLAFLDEAKEPLPELAIMEGIAQGGFRGGRHGTKFVIQKGIRNRLTGTGSKKGILKEINGLIGRGSWDDSRFYLHPSDKN